jgi:hypothetical protein
VAQRIQQDNKNHSDDDVVCRNFNRHEFANIKQHGNRQHPSLLWTIVREPRARDISHIGYFKISLLKNKVTPRLLHEAVKNQLGKQTAYLKMAKKQQVVKNRRRLQPRPVGIDPIENPKSVVSIVRENFQGYDFIGITERLAESLAVMTLLWGLQTTDVIVLNVK